MSVYKLYVKTPGASGFSLVFDIDQVNAQASITEILALESERWIQSRGGAGMQLEVRNESEVVLIRLTQYES